MKFSLQFKKEVGLKAAFKIELKLKSLVYGRIKRLSISISNLKPL